MAIILEFEIDFFKLLFYQFSWTVLIIFWQKKFTNPIKDNLLIFFFYFINLNKFINIYDIFI